MESAFVPVFSVQKKGTKSTASVLPTSTGRPVKELFVNQLTAAILGESVNIHSDV